MRLAPTITQCLDAVLEEEPGRVAVVGPAGALTYEELDAAADAAAAALVELGVGRGDRLAVCLPNDLDIVVAFHGAMRLGAIWVGINRNLVPVEKEAVLAASRPTLFLAAKEVAAAHDDKWRALAAAPGSRDGWVAAVQALMGAPRREAPDPAQPAGIAFTSGTTGDPKGIVHSQRNLLLPAAAIAYSRQYDRSLRKGDCLPLTILNLQVLTTLLTSAAGGCCLLTDRRDARGVAEWIGRYGINVWNGVPAILHDLSLDLSIEPAQLQSLREVWSGGAPCPEDLFGALHRRFGVRLYQTYGLTEAPTVVSIEPLGGEHTEGSTGVPLPHLEVLLRDDEGNQLPTDRIGEIVVRASPTGPWAHQYRPPLGSWAGDHLEESTATELPTGDIGVLDEVGNLYIRDRKKLMILRGGANVYPAEVERVIERLPGVRAAAVLGLADLRLGQRVVAVVEPDAFARLEPDAVLAHCKTLLSPYKVPEEVRIVPVLPRNAMGKVQRVPLAELFSAG